MVQQSPTLPRRATLPRRFEDASADTLFRVSLYCAIAIGIAVRSFHVLKEGFPLNDGGLFFVMVRDLQANSYRLPAETSYNAADIPFGYPPLTMYLAGFLDDVTPFSLMTLFRLLPLLATCGTLVAFAFLARDLLRSRMAVVFAVLAFALIPRTYIWLLMGGGLTRSFGLLFAILALTQVYRMYTRRDRRYAIPATLLAAATVLSHVETGWFLCFSIALFWVAFGRHRHSIASSAIVAFGTLVLTSPWWLTVLSYHGPEPFLAAQEAGGSAITDPGVRRYIAMSLARVVATSEPWYPLIGTIGFLGIIASVATRRYALAAWVVAVAVLDPRAYPTLVSVPMALLAGIGVAEVIVPLLRRLNESRPWPGVATNGNGNAAAGNGASGNGHHAPAAELRAFARTPGMAIAVVFFAFCVVGAFIDRGGLAGEGTYLHGLEDGERELMAWIALDTPEESRVMVIPRSTWEIDREAEWFPVLAQRQSVTTVQGFEWVGDGEFEERQEMFWWAFNCGFRETDCLIDWMVEYPDWKFDYVWIPRINGGQCCGTLVYGLNNDPNYTRIYDSGGGTIWRREDSPLFADARSASTLP